MLLYEDLSYKIRGAVMGVWEEFGPAFKESAYQKALALEFKELGILFEQEKRIPISYKGEKVGVYQPDFVINGKIIVELKVVPKLLPLHKKQLWYYLKGGEYKLGMLVNFGAEKLEIKRVVYDTARGPRKSA